MKIDPNQPIKLNLSNLNLSGLFSNIQIILAIFGLIFALYTLSTNLIKLNTPPELIPPTTLLNQAKIQEATQLIEERTIFFSSD